MKSKNNLSNRSALSGLSSIVNSQNDSLTQRILQSNYSKKDLTISNSTSNLSHTIQQYQQQLSNSSQQASSNSRPKYFLNNSSNGLLQPTVSTSLEKRSTGNSNYFFKNGTTNSSQLQQQYIQQQLQLQQKSFDSLSRQNAKSESNSSYLQNRVKSSRSIVNYNVSETNISSKPLPTSSRNLSPLTLNQLDQTPPFLRAVNTQQENIQAKNSSKSPSSIKNSSNQVNIANITNVLSSKNSMAPLNKILTPNINLSNIFKSSNSNHLLLSNAVKKPNQSLTNLNNASTSQNNQNLPIQTNSNSENRIQPLSSAIRQDKNKNNGFQIPNSSTQTQRSERSATTYEETDPKKQKIVENIIENILNTEPSVQETNNQISLYEENRSLLNNQKRLTAELESLKNSNEIFGKENHELKEAIKAEREKFKEELTKHLYEINNLKQCEELYKNEKSMNEKYSQNLKVLEESFMNYKNDLVGLIYDTFEIVLTTKGFNTHLKSIQLSQEESLEVSKKSSDLMQKLNPFVIDLDIQNQLKDVIDQLIQLYRMIKFIVNNKQKFGNVLKNNQNNAFYESLQNYNQKNKNCMQDIGKDNKQMKKQEIKENDQNMYTQQEEQQDLEIVLNDFEDDRIQSSSQQSQQNISNNSFKPESSDYKQCQQELTYLKSILASNMSNNNNSIKIKSMALEARSNQEISCQYSQECGSSIQSSRMQLHKNSQQEKVGVKLQDYISFNTNENNQDVQIQQLNIIQEEETPSKPPQNPLDQFLLVTSNYKPKDFQLDILKDQELIQGLDETDQEHEESNQINKNIQSRRPINSQLDYSKKQEEQNNNTSILSSNYNLPKQIPIQPKNFMLQLVSPSSDSSQRHIFDQSKHQDFRNEYSKIMENQMKDNLIGQLSTSQQQFDPLNKLQDISRISNISTQSNNNQNLLSSLKSQTANNLKTITNTVSIQKSLSNTNINAASKHKQQESMESQGFNDGQLSSGQNTVIYHHSKQVSQLSQYTQSNHKNFVQNINQQLPDDTPINTAQPTKDKEIDILELSPCFSSSRVHDLDQSNSMNPLDIHKKQSLQQRNLIQNKHLNQNSIHYLPQQISEQPYYNQKEISSPDKNNYYDQNTSQLLINDYIEESPQRKSLSNKIQINNTKKGDEINQPKNDIQSNKVSTQQSQKPIDESCKIDSTMAGDEFVIAEYNFKAQKENDLEFSKGDKIQVLKRTQNGWWIGLCRNRIGYFPFNFVSEIKFS